jgi:hypothetical protein
MRISRTCLFTLALAFCGCSILAVILGIPYVVAADRAEAQAGECAHELFYIWEMKSGWVAEHTNAAPSWADFPGWPSNRCPGGGTWTLGHLGELPTCSIPSHAERFKRNNEAQERELLANSPEYRRWRAEHKRALTNGLSQ